MLINIHTHHPKNPALEILNSDKTVDNHLYSFGILNENPKDMPYNYNESNMEEIVTHQNCIAIGEIGLDKTISLTLDKQKELFIKQLIISEKYKLPVILHCVKSWNEMLEIRKEINPKQPWIFHGFRKTSLLDSVLNSGTHISIGTAVIWDEKLQECVKSIPLDRLFLETDNDTNYTIEDVYSKIALIKNISLQSLEIQLSINIKNNFRKWGIG